MKTGKRSRTADGAAALRASHYLYAEPRVFADAFALMLTSAGWRVIVRNRFLHWLMIGRIMDRIGPVIGQILARARYAEDKLEAARARGVNQYVIISAGLDSFALRRRELEHSLRIYEVDRLETQQAKLKRLARRKLRPPCNTQFIAADFEHEELSAALERSSLDRTMPAFYSWLGATHYLRPDATLGALRSLSEFAAPGSEIVFDYSLPRDMVPICDKRAAYRFGRRFARRDEPFRGCFRPEQLHAEAGRFGFETLEDLSGAEQTVRYFSERKDQLCPTGATHFVHLRLERL